MTPQVPHDLMRRNLACQDLGAEAVVAPRDPQPGWPRELRRVCGIGCSRPPVLFLRPVPEAG